MQPAYRTSQQRADDRLGACVGGHAGQLAEVPLYDRRCVLFCHDKIMVFPMRPNAIEV
jgi:hypothetical protein